LLRFKRKVNARMVKLVDTLVSGTSDRKVVQVRVLFRALKRVRNSSLFYFLSVQKDHAQQWILFPENIGPYLSLDETSLSNGELYTILTNKQGKGQKGTLIAMIEGTQAYDALQEIRIAYRWDAINQKTNAIENAQLNNEKYEPTMFANGDTKKQLLPRSRYLLFKSAEKWAEKQKQIMMAERNFADYGLRVS
jgi:transposase